MTREHLLQKLHHYKEAYPAEVDVVDRFIAFVSENEACFHRSLTQGHVTGSAWVVDRSKTKVLLTHHKKLNRWLQLGGHADGNSDMLSVAIREVEEESGLEAVAPGSEEIFDVDIHLIPERGSEPEHYHYDIRYVVENIGSDAYTVSDESNDLKWIPIETLSHLTDEESMHRMARKWRAVQAGAENVQ